MKLKEEYESILSCDKEKWDWHKYNYSLKDRYIIFDAIQEFWAELREQIRTEGYSFNNIAFPNFRYANVLKPTFWESKDENTFRGDVHFYRCKFFDKADFSNMVFENQATFGECEFDKRLSLLETEIKGDLNLNQSNFHGLVWVLGAKVRGDLNIRAGNEFNKNPNQLDIQKVTINGSLRLNKSHLKSIIFHDSEVAGNCDLSEVNCDENFIAIKLKCDSMNFTHTRFGSDMVCEESQTSSMIFNSTRIAQGGRISNSKCDKFVFENIAVIKPNELLIEGLTPSSRRSTTSYKFINSRLNEGISLRRVDLSDAVFKECDVDGLALWNVEFNWARGRVILANEDDENLSFKENESVYRQFKKNFAAKHDWRKAGTFYVSEMEMVRKRQIALMRKFPKNFGSAIQPFIFGWFLMGIYKRSSRYTQDPVRALTILVVVILVFSVLFYFHPSAQLIFQEYPFWQKTQIALHKSTSNAIPFILSSKIEDNLQWSWISAFEKLLGTILSAFFILSLRNRLRQ